MKRTSNIQFALPIPSPIVACVLLAFLMGLGGFAQPKVEIKPSEGFVPTRSPKPTVDYSQPYDPDTLEATLKKAIPANLWPHGENMIIDPLRIPHLELVEATFTAFCVSNVIKGADTPPVPRQIIFKRHGSILEFPPEIKAGKPRGRIDLSLPESLHLVKVPAGTEPNKTFPAGKATLTVERIENDVAVIRLAGGRIGRMQAIDKDGLALSQKNWPSGEFSRSVQYKGTVHQLQVVIYSEATRDLAIEFDASLQDPRSPKKWDGRDRFRYRWPREYPEVEGLTDSDFEDLEVVWLPKDPVAGRTWSRIEVPGVKKGINALYGLKEFPLSEEEEVKFERGDLHRGIVYPDPTVLKRGDALYGLVALRGYVGGKIIEVEKTGDGESVPFTILGKKGEVTFDKHTVRVELPEGIHCKVQDYLNADEIPLRYDGYWTKGFFGIPVKVRIFAAERKVNRNIPVTFEIRPYDKDAFRAHMRKKALFEAAAKLRSAGQRTASENIAGFHYVHGEDKKPQALIPLELAQADLIGAKTFGYVAKPFLGYHFVTCTDREKDGKPAHLHTSSWTKFWDGGIIKLPAATLDDFNLVPVDPSEPTYHVTSGEVYQKTLAVQAGPFRLAPDVRDEAKGWKKVLYWHY